MAITSATDIVLGVARAADPSKAQAAADRLTRLSETADGPSVALPASTSPQAPNSPYDPTAYRGSATAGLAGTPPHIRRKSDAYGQFEAFVLQSFVQSMLPKHAARVFGRGTAGEIWKSFLAEQLANELARSGELGIAKRIATKTASDHSTLPPAAAAAGPTGPTLPQANHHPDLRHRLLDAAANEAIRPAESRTTPIGVDPS